MYNTPFDGHIWLKYAKFIFVFWAIALVAGVGGFYAYSSRFIASNIYLGDEPVSGMTREEVLPLVQYHVNVLNQHNIQIADMGMRYDLKTSDMGISFDAEKTLNSLFQKSRSVSLKAQVLSAEEAIQEKHQVQPFAIIDEDQIRAAVEERLAYGQFSIQNAEWGWSSDLGWVLRPERSGRQLIEGESERITRSIVDGIYDLSDSTVYRPHYKILEPSVTTKSLEGMRDQLNLFKEPITVHFGGIDETLDIVSDPLLWIQFDYTAKTVGVNADRIQAYVADFASRYNLESSEVTVTAFQEFPSEYAKNETYKKAVIDGEFHSGRQINQERLTSDLTSAFFIPPEQRGVEVPFDSLPVKVNSAIPGVDFPDLISVGQSNYHLGNTSNRVHNIKHALMFQDLVVIAPGETFSYDKVLGWVTLAKGYQNGQVIFGNSIGNVPGGGVCQTSTTMFRAAVNAGLPIVKRQNHSWDVHYYQDWHGVDATVYPPGKVDLMFTNDTPGYILVHAYADSDNEMAFFELYGTDDGRKVSFETVENVKIGQGRRIVTDWNIERTDGTIEKREIISQYRR